MQVTIAAESKNLFADILNQDSSDDEDCDNDIKKCMITKQPLTYNSITLGCGHKFNYEPLLKEVISQKCGFNPLNVTHLHVCEIQCPYCRKIQDKVLPFIKIDSNPTRINGVTGPKKHCMNVYNCQWEFKTGKNKGNV